MNINDMLNVALTNLNEVLADENSLNCVNRLKLKKAESLIKLANSDVVTNLSDLYWNSKQFSAIANSFMSNGNNDNYCFYFLADESERIITIGRADPMLLCYVLDDVKDRYKELRGNDKSNNHD